MYILGNIHIVRSQVSMNGKLKIFFEINYEDVNKDIFFIETDKEKSAHVFG